MVDPKIILRKGNYIKIVKPKLNKDGKFISYGFRQSDMIFDEFSLDEHEVKIKEDRD